MSRFIFSLIILFLNSIALTQGAYPKLYFEIGYNYQQVKMEKFNNHLDLIETDVFKLDEHLENVQSVRIALKYKPKPLLDFGIYIGTQSKVLDRNPIQKKLNTDLTTTLVEGYHKNQIESYDLGLSATLYLGQLLEIRNRLFKRINFGLEFNGGVGFSKYYSETHYVTFSPIGVGSATRKAKGIQGQLGINLQYNYLNSTVFSSIGIRVGYQYFRTSILENYLGYEWGDQKYQWTSAEEPISFDFSGIYYGIYLKFGK